MSFMIPASVHLKELEAEAVATRKCLERISEKDFEFKPHPTSMAMGYLAQLVADIPRWITIMIEENEIDFATYKQAEVKTAKDLVNLFDDNMAKAKKALNNVSEDTLKKTFYLKRGGEVVFKEQLSEYIGPTINHWVHHRGQLTTYMRLREIAVPSIYGPSADERW